MLAPFTGLYPKPLQSLDGPARCAGGHVEAEDHVPPRPHPERVCAERRQAVCEHHQAGGGRWWAGRGSSGGRDAAGETAHLRTELRPRGPGTGTCAPLILLTGKAGGLPVLSVYDCEWEEDM